MVRRESITVRLAPEERIAIERAAAIMRIRPSQYVRWLTMKHVEKLEKLEKKEGGEGRQAQKA